MNAFEHGNLELRSEWKEELLPDSTDRFGAIRKERLLDPDYANRTVTICSWFDGVRLEISVRDQGRGFLHERDNSRKSLETGVYSQWIRSNLS
jgi:hypothetical protein